MKVITMLIILLLIIPIGISGCEGKAMFGNLMLSNEEISNTKIDELLIAIEDNDTDRIISMFSPDALENLEDFHDSVDLLCRYYQGNHMTYDNWGGPQTSTTYEDGHRVKEISASYDVYTDSDTYRIAFLYISTDNRNQNNIGLHSLYIIRLEDDIDPEYAYWGDHLFTPGIQIGIKISYQ